MIIKDNLIVSLANFVVSLLNKMKFYYRKIHRDNKKKFFRKQINESIYIILNGPSLVKQDISVLKNKNVMFVNRGFKHELYKEIQPMYHVFVDPKLKEGVWPVSWLDEILKINPGVIFIMPLTWSKEIFLQPYIERKIEILWIENDAYFECLGVSGSCFKACAYLGYSKVYFTGFDANGIAYELINHQSHFYGSNEENNLKTTQDYIIDLYMHSRHLNDLRRLAKRMRKNGVDIINVTEGGLLDMFPRKNLIDTL